MGIGPAVFVAMLLASLPAQAQPQPLGPSRDQQSSFFSRIGRALDHGVVRGRELVAEGAEGAGRGLQRAGEATGRAADQLGRRVRPDNTAPPSRP